MKRFLLIFGLFLLFATQAQAQSCGSGKYFYVSDGASGCDGSDACKAYERCYPCPSGCLTCHGFRAWDTSTQWGKTWWIYSSHASCDTCEPGYELKKYYHSTLYEHDNTGRTEYYSCDRKTITCPSNCSSCSSSSTCTVCNSGYTLQNGRCVKKAACPANCAQCDSSSGSCTKCNGGYKLKNGVCEAETTEDTNTIAGNCPPGTTKSADGCCCMPN